MSPATRTRAERARPRDGARHTEASLPANFVLLVAIVGVLVTIGVVMVLSASSILSLASYGNAWHFFERQLVWTALGVVAFAVVVRIDYHRWQRAIHPLVIASGVLLVLVLVPKIGVYVGGSRRWLGLGPWRFQPSELAKLALLLFAADLVARRADELFDWRRVLRPVLLVLVGLGALVCLEPDLDSTLVLGVIVMAVLFAGGVRARHLAVVGGGAAALALALAIAAPYRRARVLTFLEPTADASNAGYQIVQSLIALGSGGVDGVGLGAGRAKWLFLPNAHTDFIFAVIGEELGLIGTLTVLGLFVAFAAVGIRTAMRAPDRFGMLVATGVTVWIVAQAAVNIGGVTGVLPVSGIPLPFVSFGGSALVFSLVAAGILANVAKQAR
ncbi:MAG TPA: putative lipid II flippase FtsW [Acidimicrobiia bacterium]|jgi:cell division protein FtsW